MYSLNRPAPKWKFQWLLLALCILAGSLHAQNDCDDAVEIASLPYTISNQPVFGFGDDIDCGLYIGDDYFFTYLPTFDHCADVSVSFTAPFVGSVLCVIVSRNCPYQAGGEVIAFAQYENPGAPFSGSIDLPHLELSADSIYFIAVQLVASNVLPRFSMTVSDDSCPPSCPTALFPVNQSTPFTIDSLGWENVNADSFIVYFGTTPSPNLLGTTQNPYWYIPTWTDTLTRYWRIEPVLDGIHNPNCIEATFQLLNPDLDAFPSYLDFCPAIFSNDNLDTDNDMLGNACDPDDDNDNLPDSLDNCPLHINPNQEDQDMDGTGDVCEMDYDDDGILNLDDNCIAIANPDQNDTDGDGWGDVCDTCPLISNPDQLDQDLDGYGNLCDNCPEYANVGQTDFDIDGTGDPCDNCPSLFNPLQEDSEDHPDIPGIPAPDGIGDACDNCPLQRNHDQADLDQDGIGDFCDTDRDGDGHVDWQDNCHQVYNPDQLNQDSDFFGDACDNCPTITNGNQLDSDEDGIGNACDLDPEDDGYENAEDNCPAIYNPNQADTDNDGLGNVCDNCPSHANANQSDTDGDQIGDLCDNCPDMPNTYQIDTDHDGLGDACDLDDDNDGVADGNDNCMVLFNSSQTDTDEDTFGDPCDNCPLQPQLFQSDEDNDGVGDLCDTIFIAPKVGINTDNPLAVLHVAGGHIYIDDEEGRIIFRHVNGYCYKIKITDSGFPAFSGSMTLERINCLGGD